MGGLKGFGDLVVIFCFLVRLVLSIVMNDFDKC